MNENIDLTKILECAPKSMKLYSPLFGEVSLEDIESATHWPIVVSTADGDDGDLEYFLRDGRFYDNPNGECLLFPSKENRDWSTFNIIPKVGDVVKSVITQTVYIKGNDGCMYDSAGVRYLSGLAVLPTEEEKNEFFRVLELNGLRWDDKQGKVVKDEPEVEYNFKPFDKVLVRDSDTAAWKPAFFSEFAEVSGLYVTIGGIGWSQCIPYESNEDLCGTADSI